MRLTAICIFSGLLLASCSSSPDGNQPVATFDEMGKPPSAVLGFSFDDNFGAVHAHALALYDGDKVTTDGESEVRIKGRFWGCKGEARVAFTDGGQSIGSLTLTMDTAPDKLLEVIGHELEPGAPYLFRRTEAGATWHWSYSSQALFDVALQAADDNTSRVVYTRVRREVETISPLSTSPSHGSYHNLDLEEQQTE